MSRLLTSRELADKLNIAEKTVRKLAQTNQLPQPIRIGSNLRWDADEVEQFIKAKGGNSQ